MSAVLRIVVILTTLVFFLSKPDIAEASCGLDYCSWPSPQLQESTKRPLGKIQWMVRHVDFSIADQDGSYLESLFRLEVHYFENWNVGAWVAPVRLSLKDETRTGITNPVLFVERGFRLSQELTLTVATQLELPMGDSHDGIASAHTEVLPYVGVGYDNKTIRAQVQLGGSMALGETHDHGGGDVLFVNPHADKEALLRVAVTVPLLDGRLQPGFHLNSRYVIDDAEDRAFVTGSLVTSYQLTQQIDLLGQVEAPITSAHRFDWRAGVGVGVSL